MPELVGLSPPLCANGCEFATDSRLLRCRDLLGERVLQVSSPRGRAISNGLGTNQAKSTSMGFELVFENERCSKQEQNSKETTLESIGSADLPPRKGRRRQTIRGPLHIHCNGYGASRYVNQLVDQVLTWPHIESSPPPVAQDVAGMQLFFEPEKNLGSSFENRRANIRAGERITPIT